MKFTVAAVIAAAAGASANFSGNATVVTEVVDVYTTYCPEATKITHGSKTYTVTKATTLTITDCPCTITRPVVVVPSVACTTCGTFTNSTVAIVTSTVTPGAPVVPVTPGAPSVVPTGGLKPSAPSTVPTAGAGKAAVLSGAGLAGIVGLAAFVL